MYALIVDSTVREIFEADPHVHPDLDVRDVSSITGIMEGWVEGTDGTFVAPVADAPSKDELKTHAAGRRFDLETGGITVEGAEIRTDRDSQALIASAFAYAQAAKSATIKFKSAAGWVDLTTEKMSAIALAVGAHVQAAFAREQDVDEQIDAGTLTSISAVDAAFSAD